MEYIDEVCGLYFRAIVIPQRGTKVPQHTHPYDHATYCGSGAAIMYVDGVPTRRVYAGDVVAVAANRLHEFEALESNTRLVCVHDPRSAEVCKEK